LLLGILDARRHGQLAIQPRSTSTKITVLAGDIDDVPQHIAEEEAARGR
jgi:hypothetical protein